MPQIEEERFWLPFTREQIALLEMSLPAERYEAFAKVIALGMKKVRCADALAELLTIIPRPRPEVQRRLTLEEMELDI